MEREKVINVTNLNKAFKQKQKMEGLTGSIKSMLKPEYQEISAVSDMSFQIDRGEMLAFIGPNGAGKSTTIKMLTGILTPTSGNMTVLGLNPQKDRKQLAYKIGSVFGQKSQLWFHLPPKDSFNLLGKIYEIEPNYYKKRLDYLTEIFEIQDFINSPVRKLSLGQRIRCEIMASILHEPEIIFLDEPTIGLDVVVKQKIRTLIKDVNKETNTTLFLTSHDAGDIEHLCKRVIIINHGSIVMDDSVKNLKKNYLTRKVINVLYDEEITEPIGFGEVLKQKGSALKLALNTENEKMDEVIHHLSRLGTVLDITIQDAPLEEVIANIYEKQRKG